MADLGNTQIPQNVRDMAETTLTKARQAVEQFMGEASRLYQNADASAQAVQAGAREGARKTASYAEANIKAAFDFAEQLVKAKTVQEMGTIQQSYLKSQAEQLQSQMKDLGTTAANTAKAATPSTSRG